MRPPGPMALQELVVDVGSEIVDRLLQLSVDPVLRASVAGTQLLAQGPTASLDALLENQTPRPSGCRREGRKQTLQQCMEN